MKQVDVASTLTVWLESWEWQCCGEPFSVGSAVEWELFETRPVLHAYLREGVGEEAARTITHSETHHHDATREPGPLTNRADGWEPGVEGLSFAGYVVDLEVVES